MKAARQPARLSRGIALTAATLLGIAACNLGSPAPSVGPTLTPGPPPAAALLDCDQLNLLSPRGTQVDLTGTWEGAIFIHHVRQIGGCVWWIGYGRWPGTEPGDVATLTFLGKLTSDFTLTGGWTTIVRPNIPSLYYGGPQAGSVAFLIGFDPDTGAATTLTRVGAGRILAEYPSDVLSLVGPLPDSANPPQQ